MRTVIGLTALGMLCWLVMFLAGTDVWHFGGSPDFWRLSEPPYTDLRVFAYAFYLQFVILLVMFAVRRLTCGPARAHRGREPEIERLAIFLRLFSELPELPAVP